LGGGRGLRPGAARQAHRVREDPLAPLRRPPRVRAQARRRLHRPARPRGRRHHLALLPGAAAPRAGLEPQGAPDAPARRGDPEPPDLLGQHAAPADVERGDLPRRSRGLPERRSDHAPRDDAALPPDDDRRRLRVPLRGARWLHREDALGGSGGSLPALRSRSRRSVRVPARSAATPRVIVASNAITAARSESAPRRAARASLAAPIAHGPTSIPPPVTKRIITEAVVARTRTGASACAIA